MEQVTVRACAKINLTLDILGLLPNGYHRMEMIMQSVDLADTLRLEQAEETTLVCGQTALCGPDNLILRAHALLQQTTGKSLPTRFVLQKRIPMAAGLAGGSADAAAALCGLDALYHLELGAQQLAALGAVLGADVPFCLSGGACLATGDGTALKPIKNRLAGAGLVVMPCEGLSTKTIFSDYDALDHPSRPDTCGALEALARGDWQALKKCAGNALAQAAMIRRPLIGGAIRQLYDLGACYAAMSGSGPAVFGWFESRAAADAALAALCGRMPVCLPCGFSNRGVQIVSRKI